MVWALHKRTSNQVLKCAYLSIKHLGHGKPPVHHLRPQNLFLHLWHGRKVDDLPILIIISPETSLIESTGYQDPMILVTLIDDTIPGLNDTIPSLIIIDGLYLLKKINDIYVNPTTFGFPTSHLGDQMTITHEVPMTIPMVT